MRAQLQEQPTSPVGAILNLGTEEMPVLVECAAVFFKKDQVTFEDLLPKEQEQYNLFLKEIEKNNLDV